MTIALIQLNPTIGDLDLNVTRLLDAALNAQRQGASFGLASELCVSGYPPRDLLDRPSFVRDTLAATQRVIQSGLSMPLVFGSISEAQGQLSNDAIVAQGGSVLGRASKQLLPTYDVFDERRHFYPGSGTVWVEISGQRCALSICEDAWARSPGLQARYPLDPLRDVSATNADWILNLSASPFTLRKMASRARVFSQTASVTGVPVAMTNQVGANDELVFDGQSGVWNAQGELLVQAAAFSENLVLCSPETATPIHPSPLSDEAAVYGALVLGIRDYARKCGFSRAVLGLSGGIDSALVATLAADALGPSNVLGVAMPSRYSSFHSRSDAQTLAASLGLSFDEISIEPMFEATLASLKARVDRLEPPSAADVTWENVQARLRGAIIMALSNRTGALALTTGNKSEVAVGYCTLYGDMVGGLSVISDLPKTMVYRLARWSDP